MDVNTVKKQGLTHLLEEEFQWLIDQADKSENYKDVIQELQCIGYFGEENKDVLNLLRKVYRITSKVIENESFRNS